MSSLDEPEFKYIEWPYAYFVVNCPRCGYANGAYHTHCDKCGGELPLKARQANLEMALRRERELKAEEEERQRHQKAHDEELRREREQQKYKPPTPSPEPPIPSYTPPVFSSTPSSSMNQEAWDDEEDEDEDEEDQEWDEDTDEEEDYVETPPAFVYSPPSPASAPAYQEPDRHQPAQGQSRLGRDIQTGDYVDVPQAARRESLYIIGTSGTGKTGLIENLIIQDIKQDRGIGLLDPHGDLTHAVLSRLPPEREKDVIYLDITDEDYPFGLNLFTCDSPKSAKAVQYVVDKVMHIFEKLFGLSAGTTPRLRQYLRNCTQTLLVNPGYTMADMPLLLLDEQCRKKLTANVLSTQVQGFWKTYNRMKSSEQLDHADSTLNKLDELLQPLTVNIVGQRISTIDLQTIMNEGKILLVKLDAQLDSVTSLIGSVLIALILNAAYARPANKRRQFNLYADEFQRFATEDFATLLTEARKFGIATTIAHQARYQPGMTDGIRATSLSAKNLVVFKVNSEDADDLAGEFDITPQEAWEQEIEPERIKVLRPQRHERKEEQVEVEVEENIEEISQTPVDHLLRGTHRNARVRELTQKILVPLVQAAGKKSFQYVPSNVPVIHYSYTNWGWSFKTIESQECINTLLVDVMEGRVSPGTKTFADRVEKVVVILAPYIGWLGDTAYNSMKYHFDKYGKPSESIVGSPERELYSSLSALIWGLVSGQSQLNRLEQNLSSAIPTVLAKWEVATQSNEYSDNHWQQHLSNEEKEKIRKRAEEGLQEWAKAAVNGLVTYARLFVALCEELAKEENHILVPTGQKRMVKRIQPHITYLTHESEKITIPRKTIMHPQRTYADMLKQVASELVNQDNYIARVRYTNVNQRRVECTIRTLDPKQDADRSLFGRALEERIARIQAYNRTPDERGISYCRPRQEVEAEIRTRQEQCSEPPEEEPPISRRPLR